MAQKNAQETIAVIQRITRMEFYFDTLQAAVLQESQHISTDPWLRAMLRSLTDYYENGQWFADFQRDERGELPKELKRGVLSEDGVYNLLMTLNT